MTDDDEDGPPLGEATWMGGLALFVLLGALAGAALAPLLPPPRRPSALPPPFTVAPPPPVEAPAAAAGAAVPDAAEPGDAPPDDAPAAPWQAPAMPMAEAVDGPTGDGTAATGEAPIKAPPPIRHDALWPEEDAGRPAAARGVEAPLPEPPAPAPAPPRRAGQRSPECRALVLRYALEPLAPENRGALAAAMRDACDRPW